MDISINIPTEKGMNIMEDMMRPPRIEMPTLPIRSEYHQDAYAPGVTLNDFTMREPSADGTYVHVVEHKEWIEKIKQPPTPEEIEAARIRQEREDKIMWRTLAGLGLGFVAVVAGITYFDSKQAKAVVETAEKVADTIK